MRVWLPVLLLAVLAGCVNARLKDPPGSNPANPAAASGPPVTPRNAYEADFFVETKPAGSNSGHEGHEGHDMGGHEGHDMSGHEGHDMKTPSKEVDDPEPHDHGDDDAD